MKNLLPFDGEVYDYGKIFNQVDATQYLSRLINEIDWQNDRVIIFGKTIITKRKVAFYANQPLTYRYSKISRKSHSFSPLLIELLYLTEKKTAESFNCCLLNLYHDGSEAMAWHSDNEKELKPNGAIASLSFGATRKFTFKHQKCKEKISLDLHHGSLLVMKGETQNHWQHALMTTKMVEEKRINLTFRTISSIE